MPAFQPLVVVCSFAFTVTIVEKCFVFIPNDTFYMANLLYFFE